MLRRSARLGSKQQLFAGYSEEFLIVKRENALSVRGRKCPSEKEEEEVVDVEEVDENEQEAGGKKRHASSREERVIERILKQRVTGTITEYLVKWLGFDDDHNSWVDTIPADLLRRLLADMEGSQPVVEDIIIEIEELRRSSDAVTASPTPKEGLSSSIYSTPIVRKSRRLALVKEESPCKSELSIKVDTSAQHFVPSLHLSSENERVNEEGCGVVVLIDSEGEDKCRELTTNSFISPEKVLKRKRGESTTEVAKRDDDDDDFEPTQTKKNKVKEDDRSASASKQDTREKKGDEKFESGKKAKKSKEKKAQQDDATHNSDFEEIKNPSKTKIKAKSKDKIDSGDEKANKKRRKLRESDEGVQEKIIKEEGTEKKIAEKEKNEYKGKGRREKGKEKDGDKVEKHINKSKKLKDKSNVDSTIRPRKDKGKERIYDTKPSASKRLKGREKEAKSAKAKGKKVMWGENESDSDDNNNNKNNTNNNNGDYGDYNNNNNNNDVNFHHADHFQNRMWRQKSWQELAKFARMHPAAETRVRATSISLPKPSSSLSSFRQSFKDTLVNEKKGKRKDANKFGMQRVVNTFPTLQELCMKLVVDNIDCVESFGVIAPHLQRKMCDLMMRRGKLNNDTVKLFIDTEQTDLELSLCDIMDTPTIDLIPQTCKSLVRLSLTRCGKFADNNLDMISDNCPMLEELCLDGAYRIRDPSLCKFALTHSGLKSIQLKWVHKFTRKFTETLARKCKGLRSVHFAMANCLDDDMMIPFGQLKSLQSLYIEGPSDDFTDNGVISALEGSLCSIRKVSLVHCHIVTDAVLREFAQCSELSYIYMDNSASITDEGVIELVSSPLISKNLRSLSLDACSELSNDAIIAVTSNCKNLTTLLLPSLPKITLDALISIGENLKDLRTLDISWCRFVDDDVLDMFSDCLTQLHSITLWGCSRVTDLTVRLYRRLGKSVVGKV